MTGATQPVLTTWPLVGRESELEQISAAIDDADSAGVALVGPPGVGKTRLGRHVSELAALRGMRTVWVRSSRSAAAIPFAAVAPLISALKLDGELGANAFVGVAREIDAIDPTERLVLVVDDAQHLDQASAALLDQLVGRAGLFIALTVRTPSGGEQHPAEFWTHERIQRIPVGALSDTDASALVQLALGGPVDRAAVRRLVKASAGNVLYLRELVQGALESGALTSWRGMWRSTGSLTDSPRLRDLIEHRLLGLSESEREIVELVALGEPVGLALLGALVDLESVEDLERRGLLDSSPAGRTAEVRLGHPLYGEVVRTHMSPVRRARLCRSLADASDTLSELSPTDTIRVAIWRLDGGGDVLPERTLIAARSVFRSENFELAARLASAVFEQTERVDAAILLADAYEVTGRVGDIEPLLSRAYELAATDHERTAMATRLASSLFVWTDRADDAAAVLSRAAGDVTDSDCRAKISAQRAGTHLLLGDVAQTICLITPALCVTPGEAGAQASRDLGVALALAGRTASAIEQTELAISAHRGLPEAESTRDGIYHVARALALAEAGKLKRAAEIAEIGYIHAVEQHNLDGQAWFASVLGHALAKQGKLETANHLYQETATAFQELGHPGLRWGLGGIALASGQMGDRATAAAAVADLDSNTQTSFRLMDVHIERGRAWASVASGDLPSARQIFAAAIAHAREQGQLAGASAALHDLIRIGEAAARELAQLSCELDGDLARARLELARAILEKDADLAAAATSLFEGCGALLFAAESAAIEQRLATKAGDGRRAVAAAHRVRQLADQCERAATPLLAAHDGQAATLSARERDVALLAAEGLTSREIADRLYVSPRTAENHLQRVYTKLGITSRTQLALRLAATGGTGAAP